MRKNLPYKLPMLSLLILLLFLGCDKNEDVPDQMDPTNLTIEVIQNEDDAKIISIKARAENTIEYALYIGAAENPFASNTSGDFEYAFEEAGDYQISVRAYGISGRYISANSMVNIANTNPISIDQGYTTPLEYEGYTLTWHDEFNGMSLNTNDWVYETGDGCPNLCGWGNNELQYYRPENAWVADGTLTIEARNENYQNRNYTSTRIKTQNKQTFQYGRIDIRALLPKGQGIWPALWMLGSNIQTVGWPKCGEIDIMELVGGTGRDNQVHGTLHWDNNGHTYDGRGYTLSNGIFADEYHVFTIKWDESAINWYVNDIHYLRIAIDTDQMEAFHNDFFFIFNVAVGGNWPGNPDETTVFNQQLKVDYVRVFQKAQ
jgi:hypothetical protein